MKEITFSVDNLKELAEDIAYFFSRENYYFSREMYEIDPKMIEVISGLNKPHLNASFGFMDGLTCVLVIKSNESYMQFLDGEIFTFNDDYTRMEIHYWNGTPKATYIAVKKDWEDDE